MRTTTLLFLMMACCGLFSEAGDNGSSQEQRGAAGIATLEPGLPDILLLQRLGLTRAKTARIEVPGTSFGVSVVIAEREGAPYQRLIVHREGGAFELKGIGVPEVRSDGKPPFVTVEIDTSTGGQRLLTLSFVGAGNEVRYRWGKETASPIFTGKRLPALSVVSLSGASTTIRSLNEAGLVLNWWATSCAPCVEEIPLLNQMVKEHENSGISFVAVADNSREEVKDFLVHTPFRLEQYLSTSGAKATLGESFPRTLLIDGEGLVLYDETGFGRSLEALGKALRDFRDIDQ